MTTTHRSYYSTKWEKLYPEGVDSWRLFECLASGERAEIDAAGSTFSLAFIGDTTGTNSWLEVRNAAGKERRYGWGQRIEHVWQALEEMQLGWNHPPVYQYRQFQRAYSGH